MPKDAINRYSVDALIQARKVAMKTKHNTLYDNDSALHERCLKVDIRRVDSAGVDLRLEFYPRIKLNTLAGVTSVQLPSASLMWHGKRIRGLDHSITHPVLQDGVITGSIKGWHEHYWTNEDEDRNIRQPNPPVKNFDIQSIIVWCCSNWHIEGISPQGGLPL